MTEIFFEKKGLQSKSCYYLTNIDHAYTEATWEKFITRNLWPVMPQEEEKATGLKWQ